MENAIGFDGMYPSPWPLPASNVHHATCEFTMYGTVLDVYYNGISLTPDVSALEGFHCVVPDCSKCTQQCYESLNDVSETLESNSLLSNANITKVIRFTVVEGGVLALSGAGQEQGTS